MPNDNDSDLDVVPMVNLIQSKRAGSNRPVGSDEADRFVKAIERTVLFRIEWQDLLSAGPLALVHMGECFLAVSATSNPSQPLFDSHNFALGFPHISLISNVLHVSDTGVEAFNLAKRQMEEICENSDTVTDLLDDIIKCVNALPNAGYQRMLRTKLRAFLGSATDSTGCATKAHNAFLEWERLVGKLRRVVFDRQGEIPSIPAAPAVHVSLRTPKVPALTAPPAHLTNSVNITASGDPLWAQLPGIEACVRRFYGFTTYGAAGLGFIALGSSPDGRAYLTNMQSILQIYILRLLTGRITDVAQTCGISAIMKNLVEYLVCMTTVPPTLWTSESWEPWVLKRWGTTDAVLRHAQGLGFIPRDSNTWDCTDLIDREFYRLANMEIPQAQPTPLHPALAVSNADLDGLVQCTDALGKARKEIKKVVRFFDAVSILGQNIITVHVKQFKHAGDDIVSREPTGEVSQEERKDLVKHALSVKAYFSVIRAVAAVYNRIHPEYVAEGLELLVELSLSGKDEIRSRRQRSLAKYSQSLSTELAAYIEKKKRSILKEIRSEVEESVGRPAGSLNERNDEWNNTLRAE